MEGESICSKSQLGGSRAENVDVLGRLFQVEGLAKTMVETGLEYLTNSKEARKAGDE